MPELPEVETTVRGIASITGKRIKHIWSDWENALFAVHEIDKGVALKPATAEAYARLLTNREVVGVARRGKYILIRLSGGYLIVTHQKMTGHLLLGKWKLRHGKMESGGEKTSALHEKVNQYVHFVITFRDDMMLGFSDVRKFGRIIMGKEQVILRLPSLRALGPDALHKDLTPRKFASQIARKGPIKKILLDQTVVAGIGNIYSDEILFRARIHPLMTGIRAAKEGTRLFRIMRKTLNEGIRRGGASKTNYRNPKGEEGGFMEMCLVYGRAGKPCVTCKINIEKIKVGGRTASFCPKCQPISFIGSAS